VAWLLQELRVLQELLVECFQALQESMAQQALAEVPELAASVLRVELSASSLFLNLEQPAEPKERAV
jgi:hypothetical protein